MHLLSTGLSFDECYLNLDMKFKINIDNDTFTINGIRIEVQWGLLDS